MKKMVALTRQCARHASSLSNLISNAQSSTASGDGEKSSVGETNKCADRGPSNHVIGISADQQDNVFYHFSSDQTPAPPRQQRQRPRSEHKEATDGFAWRKKSAVNVRSKEKGQFFGIEKLDPGPASTSRKVSPVPVV